MLLRKHLSTIVVTKPALHCQDLLHEFPVAAEIFQNHACENELFTPLGISPHGCWSGSCPTSHCYPVDRCQDLSGRRWQARCFLHSCPCFVRTTGAQRKNTSCCKKVCFLWLQGAPFLSCAVIPGAFVWVGESFISVISMTRPFCLITDGTACNLNRSIIFRSE